MLTIIVASDYEGGIARDYMIPWYCSDDLKHFRNLTENAPMICGATTWDTLPMKVRGRKIVVLSRDRLVPSWENARSVPEAIRLATKHNEPAFVIGGARVYRELFPYCQRIIRTVIPARLGCDIGWDFDEKLFRRTKVDTLESAVYACGVGGKYPLEGFATVEYWERK